MIANQSMGWQGNASATTRLAPSRAETRLFVAELAARGLYDAGEEVQDWQIVDQVPVDAGFELFEVAWFVVGEIEAVTQPLGEPPPLAARLRNTLSTLVAVEA